MSYPSGGGDIAAGPIRLDQRIDHPLALARPLLLAVALWQFLARGRCPEVVVSCVFQIWRTHVSRARWPVAATEISGKDVEADVPLIPNSRISAASFACIEQLGVRPPPAGGWIPREAKEEAKPGSAKEEHTEWWSNTKDNEWIYHSTEDKYFHVPSNSLWERLETECCDPAASPHTYRRVDAVHLQALSHFAKSMDTALVPMAWKGWVFYTRKRTGRNRVVQPPPEPCESEGPEEEAAADDTKTDERKSEASAGKASLPLAAGGGKRTPGPVSERERSSPDAAAGKGLGSNPGMVSEAALLAAAADGIAHLSTEQKPSSLPKAPSLAALTSTADSLELPKGLAGPVMGAEDSSLQGDRPRGWCLCFRVRGRRSHRRCMAHSMVAPATTEASEAPARGTASSAATGRGSQSSAVSWTEEEPPAPGPPKEAPPLGVPTSHARRLEHFLAEVRRNPQRLVTHVERRRAGRIHAAFVVL